MLYRYVPLTSTTRVLCIPIRTYSSVLEYVHEYRYHNVLPSRHAAPPRLLSIEPRGHKHPTIRHTTECELPVLEYGRLGWVRAAATVFWREYRHWNCADSRFEKGFLVFEIMLREHEKSTHRSLHTTTYVPPSAPEAPPDGHRSLLWLGQG